MYSHISRKFTERWILGIRKDTLKDLSRAPTWVWFLRNISHAFSASALEPVRGQVFLTQYHGTLELAQHSLLCALKL